MYVVNYIIHMCTVYMYDESALSVEVVTRKLTIADCLIYPAMESCVLVMQVYIHVHV